MGGPVRLALPALLLAWVLAGCGDPAESVAEEQAPPPVPFEGEVKDEFVGRWETATKNSVMTFAKDGAATMVNTSPRGVTTVEGEWKVNGSWLLIKNGTTGGVSRYEAKLEGAKLNLKQKSTRLDVDYSKAKS